MCGTCGCHPSHSHRDQPGHVHEHVQGGHVHHNTPGHEIPVMANILDHNDQHAQANREFFTELGIFAVNLMSSPGSGKTRLLEKTFETVAPGSAAVIEGDLETENDAERIRACGVQAVQITTGMACHLDAPMISDCLGQLDLGQKSFLFIENVGNLICPVNFDLGQHANVVLLSVTEGDDKPEKYPAMFEAADLVLITKSDLLPVMEEFDPDRALRAIRRVNPDAPVVTVSSKTGEGFDAWTGWLAAHQSRPALARNLRP